MQFRKYRFHLMALVAAMPMLGPGAPAAAQDRAVPGTPAEVRLSYAPIVKRVAPAVVTVSAAKTVENRNPLMEDPFFRRFFGPNFGPRGPQQQRSLGSGVIIDAAGMVITNNHVIDGADEVKITLGDKREFDVEVVLKDARSDLAVMRVKDKNERFPFVEFGNSDELQVGDLVLAIGNPFGVGQTVTSGIISALARTEMAQSDTQVFLQTDAAINPGNSGGALVDMNGKLVGINTMIFSQSGGSVGIGFAIPSNLVRFYADNAVAGRKVERPWLGAQMETVTREMASTLGLERVSGAVITRLTNNGPATKAGMQLGDVIVNVDGFEVGDSHSVLYRLTTRGIGNKTKLDVIRNRKHVAIEVALLPAPKPGKDDVRNLSGNHPFDGARVSNILPSVADELNLDETDGVVIVAVRSGGVASRLDFQPGDIIVQIGED